MTVFFLKSFTMPYAHRRTCSICGKQDLLKLSEHLRQVHHLSNNERQPYLKHAVYSTGLPDMRENLCMETKPYPSFRFQHPATMMIVGPTQSGKSNFVEKLLQSALIKYPSRKATRIHLFYTQWQPLYDRLQATHGNRIAFTQGLPEVDENLESIDTGVNNVWVLDDLMDEAIQSPVISQLFTRGRHRNLSVILLLQNMFPKGKFNTNISRNALYKVLFRSPGDRKQIDIMAEQTFAKDCANFMKAYGKETDKPFGYIILDNHPRTKSENQVIANVFGDCYAYPYITKSSSPYVSTESPVDKPDVSVTVKRKVELPLPAAKKQKKPAKKKPAKKLKKPAQKKHTKKKPVRRPTQKLKQPRFTGGFREISSNENLPEDQSDQSELEESEPEEYESEESEDEPVESDENLVELMNDLERQAHRVARSGGGFGPGSR